MNKYRSIPEIPTLVVVAGPTAVGKTSCAIEIAKYLKTEIVSADSRQIYKELNIGVARPSAQELSTVPHHFIAEKSIFNQFTAADFQKEALERIEGIFQGSPFVVLSGGTGLYLKAILEGFDDIPVTEEAIEAAWQEKLDAKGITYLQETLKLRDPHYHQKVDLANPRRLIRALSVIEATGLPFSSFLAEGPKERPFNSFVIKLERPRTELYNRINQRVDDMMENGLEEEARGLLPHFSLRALKTVGYQELHGYFKGEQTLEASIEKIKQHTRNYAKRQLTWFNNSLEGIVLHPDEVMEYISNHFK